MLSQRKLRLLQSPIKKAVWEKAPPVKILASGWQYLNRKEKINSNDEFVVIDADSLPSA